MCRAFRRFPGSSSQPRRVGCRQSSEHLLRPHRHSGHASHRVMRSAQVCKRWQGILKNPGHGSELWREVIIDFGHELITAVHTPIAWSDRRPSDEEFRCLALHLASYGTSRVQQYVYHTHPRGSVCSSLPAIQGHGCEHMLQLATQGRYGNESMSRGLGLRHAGSRLRRRG